MIRSMTGFGRGEIHVSERKFTVEIRAVNHRYLDLNIKLPRILNPLETRIRTVLKEYMQRGKIDVYISTEGYVSSQPVLHYNEDIARQYVETFNRMSGQFSLEQDMRTSTLARCPEVLTLETGNDDVEELWPELEQALTQACTALADARANEGSRLLKDLLEKLNGMRAAVLEIEERYPQIQEAYMQKLRLKLEEVLDNRQIDESRLATELVLFSDKICTDEETVRLKSHIDSMISVLEEGGFVGRKLDFIAQEMNREANTILSKANDLTTSNIAIGLKTDIEKVREQIQNIE